MVNNEQQLGDQNDEYDQPFEDGSSESTALGQANSKGTLIVVGAAAVLILIVFSVFSGDDEVVEEGDPEVAVIQKTEQSEPVRPAEIPTDISGGGMPMNNGSMELTAIIPPPPVTMAAPTPPPLMPLSSPGVFGGQNTQAMFATEEAQERLRAPMFVSGGGSITGGSFFEGFGGEEGSQYSSTSADQVDATKTHDPRFTIGMGKIIDAVMESAIDTELPGLVRAIVSQDVYAEQGRNKLIPKGSRLVGSYSTEIARGQARVYITWERIVRPDGIDVQLDSPAADLLGKSGILGRVDNRYFEIFGSAILLSSLEVGFAAMGDAVVGGGEIDSGETGSGDATQTGDVTSISLLNAVNDFGNTVNNVAQELVNLAPVITIDQGTRIKVFVNKDVQFPESASTGGIQVIR